MSTFNRRLAAAIAGTATIGALAVAGFATAQNRTVSEKTIQARALVSARVVDRDGPVFTATSARVAATVRAADVPLPAGGTFDGVRWELGGDGVAQSDIDGVLQYNAACQWLRAWRDGREGALPLQVLEAVPGWPAMRGTESGEFLARVAAEAAAGGGETASAMLADCDASHAGEVQYAARLGLTPSR
jgi:hypothetical protein